MSELIHKDYEKTPLLLREEAENLYQALDEYGYDDILEVAYQMYNREGTPLDNNWNSLEEFNVYFNFFYKLSKKLKKRGFVSLLVAKNEEKEHLEFFTIPEISSHKKLVTEACALLGFIDSISDFFEYEVALQSLGYRFEGLRSRMKKHKKRKKDE